MPGMRRGKGLGSGDLVCAIKEEEQQEFVRMVDVEIRQMMPFRRYFPQSPL